MNAGVERQHIKRWIQTWFAHNGGPDTKAVIGISGGKDSTVVACLCVEALGKERVLGVLMPNGKQADIQDAYKVVDSLGIDYQVCNIYQIFNSALEVIEYAYPKGNTITKDVEINLAPRLRMTTLYAIATANNGRVANTCNACEDFVGYSTKFGDSAGDFSPLAAYKVSEVIAIGETYAEDGMIPLDLVHKIPSDGLCGLSDEDNLGFTYAEIEAVMDATNNGKNSPSNYAVHSDNKNVRKIVAAYYRNRHKVERMPYCDRSVIDNKTEEELLAAIGVYLNSIE